MCRSQDFAVIIIMQIFDFYTRDEYDRSYPSGTCVLLEVLPSIESLVEYFQTIINTHSVIIMNSEECS